MFTGGVVVTGGIVVREVVVVVGEAGASVAVVVTPSALILQILAEMQSLRLQTAQMF